MSFFIRRCLVLLCLMAGCDRGSTTTAVVAIPEATVISAVSPMRLDGQWDDWESAEALVSDPVGDATSDFDLSQVAATMRGTTLHVWFQINAALNLQSGPPSQGQLGMVVGLPGDRYLQINFRERTAFLKGEGPERLIDWPTLGFAAQPTFVSDAYELECDLASLDVVAGDMVSIQFDRGDELDQAIRLVVPKGGVQQTDGKSIDVTRSDSHVRIVSMNTLHQGTLDPERGPVIAQMLDQLRGDVVCFNEEWEDSLFQQGVRRVLPDGADGWQTMWSNGCAIATRGTLAPLPFGLKRAAVGLVALPNQPPIVVVSIHLVCCGHAGSEQEAKRIAEIQNLIGQIKDMRDGKFGEIARDAGVVVLGDFNLVGSSAPLDQLTDVGLVEVVPRSLVDGSTMTWRAVNPSETFWPGRLDCIAMDAAKLDVGRSFLFDHRAFVANSPEPVDSVVASDHATLVIDVVSK